MTDQQLKEVGKIHSIIATAAYSGDWSKAQALVEAGYSDVKEAYDRGYEEGMQDFCTIGICEGLNDTCWKTCPASRYNIIRDLEKARNEGAQEALQKLERTASYLELRNPNGFSVYRKAVTEDDIDRIMRLYKIDGEQESGKESEQEIHPVEDSSEVIKAYQEEVDKLQKSDASKEAYTVELYGRAREAERKLKDIEKFTEMFFKTASEFLAKKHITSANEIRQIIRQCEENLRKSS